jgi:hypothetical protein
MNISCPVPLTVDLYYKADRFLNSLKAVKIAIPSITPFCILRYVNDHVVEVNFVNIDMIPDHLKATWQLTPSWFTYAFVAFSFLEEFSVLYFCYNVAQINSTVNICIKKKTYK